jgi:hypothetical protein
MSKKTAATLTKLWDQAAETNRPDRVKVYEKLFMALNAEGLVTDATQVGWEWFTLTDEGFLSYPLYRATYQLAKRLMFSDRVDESVALLEKVLAYPDCDDMDFERGLLHWSQSTNRGKQDDPCQQLLQLLLAADFLADTSTAEGSVRLEAGQVQIKLGLTDDACTTLSTAILLFEEAGDVEGVAKAKRFLAEALFAGGHYPMSRSTNRDSLLLYEFLGNTVEAKGCKLLDARLASRTGHEDANELFEALVTPGTDAREQAIAASAQYYLAEHHLRFGDTSTAELLFTKVEPILRAVGLSELADTVPTVAALSTTK